VSPDLCTADFRIGFAKFIIAENTLGLRIDTICLLDRVTQLACLTQGVQSNWELAGIGTGIGNCPTGIVRNSSAEIF
jgi:hypothetical protein